MRKILKSREGIPKDLKSLQSIKYDSITQTIVIVGTGGTGGYVVPGLARFLASKDWKGELILVDEDVVETKNLIRQNFIQKDVGKNKAEVLATRYSAAFGIKIGVLNKKIMSMGDLPVDKYKHTILVGCVDNHKARRVMHEYANHRKANLSSYDFVWIDSGNETFDGQVICGGVIRDHNNYNLIPTLIDIYPELLDASKDPVEVDSCAERALKDPQNIFINTTAAVYVVNAIGVMLTQGSSSPIHGHSFSVKGGATIRYLINDEPSKT